MTTDHIHVGILLFAYSLSFPSGAKFIVYLICPLLGVKFPFPINTFLCVELRKKFFNLSNFHQFFQMQNFHCSPSGLT